MQGDFTLEAFATRDRAGGRGRGRGRAPRSGAVPPRIGLERGRWGYDVRSRHTRARGCRPAIPNSTLRIAGMAVQTSIQQHCQRAPALTASDRGRRVNACLGGRQNTRGGLGMLAAQSMSNSGQATRRPWAPRATTRRQLVAHPRRSRQAHADRGPDRLGTGDLGPAIEHSTRRGRARCSDRRGPLAAIRRIGSSRACDAVRRPPRVPRAGAWWRNSRR